MLWEILLIAACIVSFFLLSYFLNLQTSKALFSYVEKFEDKIANDPGPISLQIDDLKEDLLDMVHETIRNMQPPNAFDHIVGALSGPLQMWAMRKAGIDPTTGQPMPNSLPEMLEEIA